MRYSDRELVRLLEEDPERGMAALVEQYSGLLLAVSSRYLQNSEDVKDCVNDVFLEFYLHMDRFDPEKGALKSYLPVIARRRAIRTYQENRRQEEAVRDVREDDGFVSRLEDQAALEAALASLDPRDEQIIRMKYYGGMTAKEIAASLNIPYETVKKRHQRSLEKLQKALTLGLLVTMLLALLAACAYLVLRYFGFVPGYGINENPDVPIYALEEPVTARGGTYEIQIKDAWWRDGTAVLILELYGQDNPHWRLPPYDLAGLADRGKVVSAAENDGAAPGPYRFRILWEGALPEDAGDTLALTLTLDGAELPVTLSAAREESVLDNVGFYSLTEEDGGLLAVPRIENGELVVSIHPLNAGDFRTYAFLNQGMWSTQGGPAAPITITMPDGTVREGTPESYSPFNGDSYLDWYFGPAEPGAYTLNVPYVYQYPALETELSADLPLTEGASAPGVSLDLPGGTLTLDTLTPCENPGSTTCGGDTRFYPAEVYPDYSWWTLGSTWTTDDREHIPAALSIGANTSGSQVITDLLGETVTDPETGASYGRYTGYLIGTDQDLAVLPLTVRTQNLAYRWDHPFTIPMTVGPEPERASFAAAADGLGVTAVPRRANGEVTLMLRPISDETWAVSPNIAHSMMYLGQPEEPITLTAADGTVCPGQFKPGRDETYSDWDFGAIPAGEYTLRVPYLYMSAPAGATAHVPLPGGAGEERPGPTVALPGGGTLALGPVRGLGVSPDWPQDAKKTAIFRPDGGAADTSEPPLAAEAAMTLAGDGGERTPLSTGFQICNATDTSGAPWARLSYVYDAAGQQQTVLYLEYVPGLDHVEVTFQNVLYRWDHPLEVSVVIPE